MLQKINFDIDFNSADINIEALDEHFEIFSLFDSNINFNKNKNSEFSKIIGVGSVRELVVKNDKNALEQLQYFINQKKSWLFGFLSYDLKNGIEKLTSENIDELNFPLLYFYEPKFVLEFNEHKIQISYDDVFVNEEGCEKIISLITSPKSKKSTLASNKEIKERINKKQYVLAVNELKKHISVGDIYEVNFCYEYFSENIEVAPVAIYESLNAISAAPFASLCKFKTHYILSSSPERFLKKKGTKIISQPIKGTAKRSLNLVEDESIKQELKNNLKEQTENVMIVDLVRNDLSKIAQKGSVKVDELFGIYSFKQVHQMISSVSCELKPELKLCDIIKATFPMGSMTGAPKVSAMKLIEKYESTKRGAYSGSVGYIAPNGDFDFNVIIRSVLYNSENKYLSFMVGSAITANADAEKEYEECLLKAKAMLEVLK